MPLTLPFAPAPSPSPALPRLCLAPPPLRLAPTTLALALVPRRARPPCARLFLRLALEQGRGLVRALLGLGGLLGPAGAGGAGVEGVGDEGEEGKDCGLLEGDPDRLLKDVLGPRGGEGM